jgi:predicted metal-dependent HD superfamily phosphohydrolase
MPTDQGTTENQAPGEAARQAQHDALMAAWESLLPGQTAMGEDLLRRYAEPHRRYHTVDHLSDVLRQVDLLAGDHDLFLVRLAVWFHDAVYAIPPGQVTNEEASARLSLRELSRVGLEQEDLGEVARLVRLTATHRPGARDPEGELICDADLAVLAGTPEEYSAYVSAVRAEYAAVPERDFVTGRLAVLTELGDGDLFRTGKGRALNERARANIDAECRDLESRLDALVEGSGS